jgi:hypothetical protein
MTIIKCAIPVFDDLLSANDSSIGQSPIFLLTAFSRCNAWARRFDGRRPAKSRMLETLRILELAHAFAPHVHCRELWSVHSAALSSRQRLVFQFDRETALHTRSISLACRFACVTASETGYQLLAFTQFRFGAAHQYAHVLPSSGF